MNRFNSIARVAAAAALATLLSACATALPQGPSLESHDLGIPSVASTPAPAPAPAAR